MADVNGDGKPDLIVANHKSFKVGVLLGNGNGTFQAQQTFSTGAGSYPVSVAVADLACSTAFYEAVLAPLGLSKLVTREATIGFGKA